MGNYLLQLAMPLVWKKYMNHPLPAPLLNQIIMIAADVAYNLFDFGSPGNDAAQAMINLAVNVTALYSPGDSVRM